MVLNVEIANQRAMLPTATWPMQECMCMATGTCSGFCLQTKPSLHTVTPLYMDPL